MNYGKIYTYDPANGIGLRTSLFVSGCRNNCPGCFNQDSQNFGYGEVFTTEVEDRIITSLQEPFCDGITVLGGEPMEPENQAALLPFYERIRRECPGKTIWVYSGYTWEQLNDPENKRCHTQDTEEILRMIDILVDGRFVEELKDISLRFRGSSNQRIIDVKKTLGDGSVVLAEYADRVGKR